jgi:hypothetical protein
LEVASWYHYARQDEKYDKDSIEINVLMVAILQLWIPKFEFHWELAGPQIGPPVL